MARVSNPRPWGILRDPNQLTNQAIFLCVLVKHVVYMAQKMDFGVVNKTNFRLGGKFGFRFYHPVVNLNFIFLPPSGKLEFRFFTT